MYAQAIRRFRFLIPLLVAGFGLTSTAQNIEANVRPSSDPYVERTYPMSAHAGVTVSIDAVQGNDVIVSYTTEDGTAIAGEDYTASTGSVTILAGDTFVNIGIPVTSDLIYENDETFDLVLTGTNQGTIVKDRATVVIDDDDPAPVVAVNSASAPENAGPVTFTISLTRDGSPIESALPVTATYAVSDGSATLADSDYVDITGTVTFQPGEIEKQVGVPLIDDDVIEPDQDFTFYITSVNEHASLDMINNPHVGTGTIVNDDVVAPTISIEPWMLSERVEAQQHATVQVRLSHAYTKDIEITWFNAPYTATADEDYFSNSTTSTIKAGTTLLYHTVGGIIKGDDLEELDEQFLVNLTSASYGTILVSQGTLTILDNDPPPTINLTEGPESEVSEDGGSTSFVVAFSNPTINTITVDYATSSETADDGVDYGSTSGTLTFEPGESTKTVTVPINDDEVYEGDEYFRMTISNPQVTVDLTSTSPSLGVTSLTRTIVEDDPLPVITSESVVVDESVDPEIIVVLDRLSAHDVTVDYTTVDETCICVGTYADYAEQSGTLTFAPGETSKTITIDVFDDTYHEIDEVFWVEFSNPVGGVLGTEAVTVTVQDNDDLPQVVIDDVEFLESDADEVDAIFTVTLTGESQPTVYVDFATAGGTAISGVDFQSTTGTLSWGAHDTSARTIAVPVFDDLLREYDETASISLSNPVDLVIADGTGSLTIIDEDQSRNLVYRITIRGDEFSGGVPSTALFTRDRGYFLLDSVGKQAHAFYTLHGAEGDPEVVVKAWEGEDFEFILTQNDPNGRSRDLAISAAETTTGTIAAPSSQNILDYEYRYLSGRSVPQRIGEDQIFDTPRVLRGPVLQGDVTQGEIRELTYTLVLDRRLTTQLNDENFVYDQALAKVAEVGGYDLNPAAVSDDDSVTAAEVNEDPFPLVTVHSVSVRGWVKGSQTQRRFNYSGYLVLDRPNREATLVLIRVGRVGIERVRMMTRIDLHDQDGFLMNLNSNGEEAVGLLNSEGEEVMGLYLQGDEAAVVLNGRREQTVRLHRGFWNHVINGEPDQLNDFYSEGYAVARLNVGYTRVSDREGSTLEEMVDLIVDRYSRWFEQVTLEEFTVVPVD